MLSIEQEYILSVLRTSQTNIIKEDIVLSEELQDYVAKTIIKSGILLTVYKQLSNSLQTKLYNSYLLFQKQSIIQDYEGNRVLLALSNAGINCIALKGWELRKLYPNITMRQMADIDILVKPFDFDRINMLMKNLGYYGEYDSSWKHCSFIKDFVNIEVHKRLTDDSGFIQQWENSIWNRAVKDSGTIYKMSSDDFYIFHFIHLYKDFLNGSLGLRRIVDTWLLSKQTHDINFVRSELSKFNMLLFHDRMLSLSCAAMGEGNISEDIELLLKHAFANGIYGSGKSYKTGRIVTMGNSIRRGKMKSMFSAVFLPYKRMKAQYPILVKLPILLPICWIKRILQLYKIRNKLKGKLSYHDISQDDYDEMRKIFRAGGISSY